MKAHEPTEQNRQIVEQLTAFGISQDDIAKMVGCTVKTLRARYRQELDQGTTKANAKVAAALFRAATNPEGGSPSITAAIFWLKTRARWKETQGLEVTGPDGGPVQSVSMSQDEFRGIAKQVADEV